jgi:solute carrier family 13 (sodium-dependent dicarboxylate transporter), member 2/3/5
VPYSWLSRRLSLSQLVLFVGFGVAVLCWSGLVAADLAPPARASLGVSSLAVALWGSEVLALPVTALLAMVLLFVLGAVPRLELALVGFASPVLFFLLGTAAIGIAAEHSGLADRGAAWLLARSGGSGRRLLVELLVSLPVQALLVPSAISRNAILVPIYERVLARLGRPPRLGAAVMLTLGVLGPLASSALLSGGTSSVATAQALGGFNWPSWFVLLAPPYYVLLALGGLGLWLLHRPELTLAPEEAIEVVHPGPWTAAEWRVAAVTGATSLLWMLDQLTGWPPAVPALLALVVLVTPGIGATTWSAFAAQAPWGTCIVLAGAVSLAQALTASGAADWVARGLFGWIGSAEGAAPVALVICAVTALITLAIPNRAAAITLIIPLASAYASAGPLPTVAAGLVVMIVVDAETLYPAQTAANLLAYDRGYFNAGQLTRFNLLLLAATAAVIVLVALPWWALVGLP